MSCPTCDHTMTPMGCKVTDLTFYWCPRCGTIKPCDQEVVVPALVHRCRDFAKQAIDRQTERAADVWRRTGIQESINVPDRR